jgi:hypothetical protein
MTARSAWLDLYKTMLVMGMVTVHVLQLLSLSMPVWTERMSEFVNLITFSGFLLAMGIGVGLSRGAPLGWARRLRPVVMLLGAAYASSLGFALLVDRAPLTGELVLDVVSMRRLFGWSEFLASFFMLYLIIAVARPVLVWVAERPLALVVVLAACFAATLVTMDQGWPLTATLVGTTRFASFPLIPYLPWFLVGISVGRAGGDVLGPLIRPSGTFSRKGRRGWRPGLLPVLWFLSVVATGWLVLSLWQTGQLPGRFPPTVMWIVGPALVLMGYVAVAQGLGRLRMPDWVSLPGRHVLSYLLVSNLTIFAVRNLMGKPVRSVVAWLAVSAALLVAIGVGWLVRERWRDMVRRPVNVT